MNFIVFFIFLVILISTDLLLFNEEFLILICFIIFCFLFYNNLNITIWKYFQTNFFKIEKNIIDSYNKSISLLKKEKNWLKKKKNIITYYLILKDYYLKLNNKMYNKIPNLQNTKTNIIIKNKLHFVNNLESQLQKLICLIILKKIVKIIQLVVFCKNTIKINYFDCINKILLLEYLKKI